MKIKQLPWDKVSEDIYVGEFGIYRYWVHYHQTTLHTYESGQLTHTQVFVYSAGSAFGRKFAPELEGKYIRDLGDWETLEEAKAVCQQNFENEVKKLIEEN